MMALLLCLIVLVIIWVISLIRCEILTHKYYNDFEYAYSDNSMLGEMEYFKVLKCDDNTAEIYYVSKNMTAANVLTFQKQDDVWVETEWETIWSDSGSASEVIYPYWWHFIYGGI